MKEIIFPIEIIRKAALVSDFNGAMEKMNALGKDNGHPVIVSFINAHGFNLLYSDQEFYRSMSASDILLRDGKGMEMLYKNLNIPLGENLCGTDFIPYFLAHNMSRSVALFGTDEIHLQKAVENLNSKGHKVAVSADGFRAFDLYTDLAIRYKPEIIVLGMGMPKQEKLSLHLKSKLSYNCLIINGGAIIDHYGGKVKRAPLWIRKAGFEWLFRLITEPKRLFKRYVIGNFLFMKRVKNIKRNIRLGRSGN